MPKINFASRLREIRREKFDNLRDARLVNRERQATLTRELKESPLTYGEDGEMNAHQGLSTKNITAAQNAYAKKEKAVAEFKKARALDRNSKVLDGVELGKKVTFVSFRKKTYSGRVVQIDLNRGLIFLESGFFRKKTHGYNIDMLESRIK